MDFECPHPTRAQYAVGVALTSLWLTLQPHYRHGWWSLERQGSPQSPLRAGEAKVRVAQSCPTPRTVACQAPLSVEFSRQEYWSGLPCPAPSMLGVAAKVLSVFVAAQDQKSFPWGTATCSKSSAGTQGLLPPHPQIGGKPSRAGVVVWWDGRKMGPCTLETLPLNGMKYFLLEKLIPESIHQAP